MTKFLSIVLLAFTGFVLLGGHVVRKAGEEAEPIREFAADLLPLMNSKNLITSPYLVSSAFALLRAGAAGNTQAQIDHVFHFPREYNFPVIALPSKADQKSEKSGVTLEMSSTLFLSKKVRISPDFAKLAAEKFNTKISLVDMSNATATAGAINDALAPALRNKIIKGLSAERLKETDAFVLAQTLYFKGNWKYQFDVKNTKTSQFYPAGASPYKVSMMTLPNATLPYAKLENAAVVRIPYTGDSHSLLILLPDKGKAIDKKALSVAKLQKIVEGLGVMNVNLALPKFSITHTSELTSTLQTLGVKDAFGDAANFSKMKTSSPGLFLTFVLEQATFAVDERGTEATSAVYVGGSTFGLNDLTRAAKPIPFIVDHPAILVILDNKTNIPLFIVGLTDPTAAGQ